MPGFESLLDDPMAQLGFGLLVAGAPGGNFAQGMQSTLGMADASRKRRQDEYALARQAQMDALEKRYKEAQIGKLQNPDPEISANPITGEYYQKNPDGTVRIINPQYPGQAPAGGMAPPPSMGQPMAGGGMGSQPMLDIKPPPGLNPKAAQDWQKSVNDKNIELAAKKAEAQPKAAGALRSAVQKSKTLGVAINKAKTQANDFTTGILGATMSFIPGSRAHDLQTTISTIEANLGFDELQEMRNNSPTGGALGSVTERELDLLKSTVASLKQSQSPQQLQQNLALVEQQYAESMANIQKAYEQDYGALEGFSAQPQAGSFEGMSDDDIMKQFNISPEDLR